MWTENGSDFRWGIEVDIYPVKDKIREFMSGCEVLSLEDILSYF
jgi:hypothetical protein